MMTQNQTFPLKSPHSTVVSSIVSTTVAFALSRGMTLEEITRVTGVSGLDLTDPNARLPESVMSNLWHTLSLQASQAALSIEMARAAPLSFLAGLAHGMQFAEDLRAALSFLCQNCIILADRLNITLEETETEAKLIGYHPAEKFDQGRNNEVGIALTWRLINEVLGIKGCLIRVEFAHSSHGPLETYENFFQVPVWFEQPQTALVLRLESLTETTDQANMELFAFIKQHFSQVLRRIERDQHSAELIKLREAIFENASRSDFAPASAAARAQMSLRSAQRLAATHGTSMQTLIDDIRADTAKEFLSKPEFDIETVATLVGYSDDRAFRRAFKRWTGQTPSHFRQSAI